MSLAEERTSFRCPQCSSALFEIVSVQAVSVAICQSCGIPSIVSTSLTEMTPDEFEEMPAAAQQKVLELRELWEEECSKHPGGKRAAQFCYAIQQNWLAPRIFVDEQRGNS
jgi:hypothetical protein